MDDSSVSSKRNGLGPKGKRGVKDKRSFTNIVLRDFVATFGNG